MSYLVEFSCVPIGAGESLSKWVAKATQVIEASGLANELHAMGTIIEAENWHEAMDVIGKSLEAFRSQGARRVSVSIKVDWREGSMGRLKSKVEHVRQILKKNS